MLYPLTFHPLFKERLWGSRNLEALYGKALPANLPIGESWEITDRPGDVSVIDSGPLAGKDLHWLLEHHREELLGSIPPWHGRFPLLAKILDAQETLSLQVHPPASVALELQGEPKTEMWYVAEARPGAVLYAGLKRGVTQAGFEERLRHGQVAECIHRVPIRPGDAMFVPSGRVHAIGAGCILFEIQQNSDTTYRVFDWNRVSRDGQARELHVAQSVRSIDFTDFEPELVSTPYVAGPRTEIRPLVSCPYFDVEAHRATAGAEVNFEAGPRIIAVVRGQLDARCGSYRVRLPAGKFCLLPASNDGAVIESRTSAEFLVVRPKDERREDAA